MDRYRIAIILSLWCGLALGCSGIDLEAERRAIIAADRAFSESSVSGDGIEAWIDAFAADGTMFPRLGKATGHDEIRRIMAPQFGVPGLELTWEPTTVTVAAAADYAYSIGRWRLENTNPLAPVGLAGTGNYVTIWRKEGDGSWKVMVNIGNLDLPPDMQ
jgi:ketosteroid isomerase-like protein